MQVVCRPPKDTKCPSWAYMVPCWGTGKKWRVLPPVGGERKGFPANYANFLHTDTKRHYGIHNAMITAPPLCKAHFTRGNPMLKTSESVTAEGVRMAPRRKCPHCQSWHSAALPDKVGFRRCMSCSRTFNAEALLPVPPPPKERRVETRHNPARTRRTDTTIGYLEAHGVRPEPREMAVPNIRRKG